MSYSFYCTGVVGIEVESYEFDAPFGKGENLISAAARCSHYEMDDIEDEWDFCPQCGQEFPDERSFNFQINGHPLSSDARNDIIDGVDEDRGYSMFELVDIFQPGSEEIRGLHVIRKMKDINEKTFLGKRLFSLCEEDGHDGGTHDKYTIDGLNQMRETVRKNLELVFDLSDAGSSDIKNPDLHVFSYNW
jgi:hypothetical protein